MTETKTRRTACLRPIALALAVGLSTAGIIAGCGGGKVKGGAKTDKPSATKDANKTGQGDSGGSGTNDGSSSK